MSSTGRPAFLRLVHSQGEPARPNNEIGLTGSAQGLFFPSKAANTLIFADWERTSLVDIFDVLELSRPKLVFDLRVTPRFDLNGCLAGNSLRCFNNMTALISTCLVVSGYQASRMLAQMRLLIARKVGEIIAAQDTPYQGPFAFFYDDEFFNDEYIHSFATALPQKVGPWQVFSPSSRRPTTKSQPDLNSVVSLERRAIFISHATPQDNPFVEWLSSKLTLAGYEVWV